MFLSMSSKVPGGRFWGHGSIAAWTLGSFNYLTPAAVVAAVVAPGVGWGEYVAGPFSHIN